MGFRGGASARRWLRCCRRTFYSGPSPSEFRPRKALVLSKVSRYEFERRRLDADESSPSSPAEAISESSFREALVRRGSDYDAMKRHHDVHVATERRVVDALTSRGVEVRRIQRQAYDAALVDWADVIITTGGDGTFLLAASKVIDRSKPVVGINTDVTRSEGHLCVAKSHDVDEAVGALLSGGFRWMFRRRLRITMSGDRRHLFAPAVEIHNQQLKYPEYRYIDLLQERSVSAKDHPLSSSTPLTPPSPATRILPVLALNEVFVGESLSSRVSHLELRFDAEPRFVKSRCSGVCISTGTGSTSWTYNINKLTAQSVERLMRIISEESGDTNIDRSLVDAVTRRFNEELLFDPEADRMSYTIRDPIVMSEEDFVGEAASKKKPRGAADRMEIKSRCFDACLVIDGSLSYKFNDGTSALVEIKDEDALRTVQLLL